MASATGSSKDTPKTMPRMSGNMVASDAIQNG